MSKYFFFLDQLNQRFEKSLINSMMQRTFLEKLSDDGIKIKDYNTHKCWYTICPSCNGDFDSNTLHNVLKCGHVCCDQCKDNGDPCACCKSPKIVKIHGYTELVEHENKKVHLTPVEDVTYDLHVQISSSHDAISLSKISQSKTIGQILTQFPQFVEFQKILKSKLAIIIRSKTFLYENVKAKKLSQLSHYLSRTHYTIISVFNRQLGGIK